jgi:hypothetical protein
MKTWVLAITMTALPAALQAQTPAAPVVGAPATEQTAPAPAPPQATGDSSAPATPPPAATGAAAAAAAPAIPADAVVIPSGTKVLLSLKTAVDTSVAKPGDQIFLVSTFPVIANSRVVIPEGMSVIGVVDSVVRPGRVKGRAAVTMHFSTLILPNGTVVNLPGSVYAVPGANGPSVKGSENTIKQAGGIGQDGRNVETSTSTAVEVGGLAGMGAGNIGAGVGYGAAAGGAAGLVYTLMTRGKDVVLQVGQPIEMALQRPLILTRKDVYVPPQGTGPQYVPSPNQPQPLPKPKPQP